MLRIFSARHVILNVCIILTAWWHASTKGPHIGWGSGRMGNKDDGDDGDDDTVDDDELRQSRVL